MHRFALLLILTTATSSFALSDTLIPVYLDSLFKEAGFVGVIQVSFGEREPERGSIYKATVLQTLKGRAPDSVIYFGKLSRCEIGGTYLVFFTLSDTSVGKRKDWFPILKSSMIDSLAPFYEIMFLGFGMMPIERVYFEHEPPDEHPFGYHEDAVKVPTSHVILPQNMISYLVDSPERLYSHDNIWKNRWVKSKAMLLHLSGLAQKSR
jgi:hypothetical protein